MRPRMTLWMLWALLALAFTAGCTSASPPATVTPTALSSERTSSPPPSPSEGAATPTDVPQGAPTPTLTATSPAGATEPPAPATVTPAPGELKPSVTWVHYPSLNQAVALAFENGRALWVGTLAGVVRWDLATDTPTHFVFDGCEAYLPACDPAQQYTHALAVVPDGDGGLPDVWAATSGGVRRFSGGVWTTYTEADGLPSSVVYAIAVAPSRAAEAGTSTPLPWCSACDAAVAPIEVWAGTDSGLAHFDGVTWQAVTEPGTGAGVPIWSVAVTPSGVVWASTHLDGVARYDPENGDWRTYGVEDGFAFPNARALAVGPGGEPWVHIGYDGVYRLPDGAQNGVWEAVYPSGGGEWVCGFAFGGTGAPYGGGPYIATCGGFHASGDGLAYREGEVWANVTAVDGLPDDDLNAVAVSADGEMAVGSRLGVGVYENGEWRILRAGPSLPGVSSVAVRGDGAWFGFGDAASQGAGGGVSHFDGQRWVTESFAGQGARENVRALAVGSDGVLWGGAGCTVARRGAAGWTVAADCETLSGNVHALAPGPAGEVWVATDFDVYRLDGADVERYESLVPLALAVDGTGTGWVSRSPIVGGGLFAYRDGDAITQTLPITMVTTLAADPADAFGRVWAAGQDRLFAYDGLAWAESPALPNLVDLTVDADGMLWAAAGTAIYRLQDGDWTLVTDLGIPVRIVVPAAEGLWLGTELGVVLVE